MPAWSWPRVWEYRLRHHWLTTPAAAGQMVEVAGGICGIHAQVAASAELSLGLRVARISRQDIRKALWQDRTLVKTYGLRGTLHLFPAHELPLWLAALRARTRPAQTNPATVAALPPERRAEILDAICESLDGHALTRQELGQAIEQRCGAWATEPALPAFGGQWPRWQLALAHAATHGSLVFGPNRGNRVTYVRLDQWLGQLRAIDEQTALREVCRRFMTAYGPATHVEFARWFDMQPRAARTLIESLGDEVQRVDVEGWTAWLPVGASPPPTSRSSRVHLLPHFDPYVVGGHPRAQLIPAAAPAALRKGTAAPFAVLLVDGVIGGLWRRQHNGKRLEIRVAPFEPLSTSQSAAVQQQAERVAQILEAPLDFAFASVEARAHL